MLTLIERTLSSVRAMRGDDDPFVTVAAPYATTVEELVGHIRSSRLGPGFSFSTSGEELVGVHANSIGNVTHRMIVRGDREEIATLGERLTAVGG